MSDRPTGKRRVNLQIKFVVGLLVIALVPLAVSAILIEEISRVAQNFASNQIAALRPALEESQQVYLDLFEAKKDQYRETALRLAGDPAIARAAEADDADVYAARIDEILATTPELAKVALRDPRGAELIARSTDAPLGVDGPVDERVETVPIAGDAVLELTFAAPDLQDPYDDLGEAITHARSAETARSSLPVGYQIAFLCVIGGVVVLVTAIGLVLARRITRRIEVLVGGTRAVAAGDLTSRLDVKGRDELSELGWAFNTMIADLEADREQIAYLQRVGAWQDVARKLAHEIKNPLTPIQLAVQQCVSSYDGDDPRYQKLLADTEEIVSEEISSLRRLVDAFRTLGQLPRVEPEPLDFAVVMGDLEKDPVFAGHLELRAPEEPAHVRGDRQLLRRVLANLVENGMQSGQAAGRAGRVVVAWRAEPASGRAVVTVDDEGGGIDAALRERIFEPYVTSKDEGTGLGLTICKKIALEHRGSLAVDPDPAPTGGARFVLRLELIRHSNGEREA